MALRIAFVVRYRDHLLGARQTTVGEHNALLLLKGKAWLGKFGLPVSSYKLNLCSNPAVEPCLVLVRARHGARDTDPRVFIATLSAAQNEHPDPTLIPEYYRKYHDVISTWFCLSSPIKAMATAAINSWVIISSGQPLSAGIRKCPRPFFLVTRNRDLEQARALVAAAKP